MKERRVRSPNRKTKSAKAAVEALASQVPVSQSLKGASMVWKGDNQNRLAKCLVTLIDDVTQKFPGRNTRNDGTIGDVAHQQRPSDHNPGIHEGGKGVVTALDITHDPAHGFDAGAFAESLRQNRDPRIKYVIFNGRIFNSKQHPWEWRPRGKGPGDHTEHVHVSVLGDAALFDDTSPWQYDLSGAVMTSRATASPPKLKRGDTGPAVHDLQNLLGIESDGVFGEVTENAVIAFQQKSGLFVDGIVGSHTWGMLQAGAPVGSAARSGHTTLAQEVVDEIARAAAGSSLAAVRWRDRGAAPIGYIKGMAVTYGLVYAKWKARDSAALAMAAMNSGDEERDALASYGPLFRAAGMDNSLSGEATLRHLFVLLIGLGMRESSGKYFEGRDMSTNNVDADTAEAGLFQMSWNARSASPELPRLFAQYSAMPEGFLSVFQEGLQPRETDNFGSGDGATFQRLCKTCPAFAVEAAAIGLRVLRRHWGPINRQDAEIRPEADALLKKVEEIVDLRQPVPVPVPTQVPRQDPMQLLLLVLLTLLKEKPMAQDPSRQALGDPLAAILPIILQAALSGRQPNIGDILTTVLTGKPAATQVVTPIAAPTQAAPASQPTDLISLLLPVLLSRLTGAPLASGAGAANDPVPSTVPAAVQPSAPLAQVKDLLQTVKDVLPQPPATAATSAQQEQTQKILDLVKVVLGGVPKLGPVNGALGQTVGNLLDGKKSAIGIGGAILTSVLQAAAPALPAALTGLVGAFPLGQIALPLFLGMTAWGALGKVEKWSGNSK